MSYLYPRYWQVETESGELQVSAQAVRRLEPTWNWRRLEPFTCKNAETCGHESAVHSLMRRQKNLKNLLLTTVCLIRVVRAVSHTVTPPVAVDTASRPALELAICTRSCWRRIETVGVMFDM